MSAKRIDMNDIVLATQGDSIAMQKVVDHFKPFIREQSLIDKSSTAGTETYIDYDRLDELTAHLMISVAKFDYSRYLEEDEAVQE